MHYTTIACPSELAARMQEPGAEQSLYAYFQQVTDHRKLRGRRYEAAALLTLLVLAKLAGERKISGIAHWVRLRGGWLCEKLLLVRKRLPCVNTYRYILAHVDEQEMEAELQAFMAAVISGEEAESADGESPLPQIVVDGKALCGSDRHTPVAQAPQMVVSAWHVWQRRVWAQQAVAGRGREKQAAMRLLTRLPLTGQVVSADALYTSPNWCRQVRRHQGHYLLIVKTNRRELYEDIDLLFAGEPLPDLPEQQAQTVDKGHGRLEIRHIRISSALTDYLRPGWPDVAQVFQVQRMITRRQRTTCECAYGFTSLPATQASPAQVLRAVRQHWQIENVLHYRRDVTLGEDACLVSQGQAPRILALLNNVTLFLIDRAGGSANAAAKIREFAACPQSALDLILHPP